MHGLVIRMHLAVHRTVSRHQVGGKGSLVRVVRLIQTNGLLFARILWVVVKDLQDQRLFIQSTVSRMARDFQ